ncbi:hypothetical protein PR048_010192 [Dryococelus australis]|uniref:Uncharacterized protein n=1 Tax=Dryococelus australis TaxID=614101 RepID=A0ABQ9I220_9NEOP|nr:hypothetical protein PR048_010192 [Dryococelus australis]
MKLISYQARCAVSVVAHNSGARALHYQRQKKILGKSPGKFTKRLEAQSICKVDSTSVKQDNVRMKIGLKPKKLFCKRKDVDTDYVVLIRWSCMKLKFKESIYRKRENGWKKGESD